jgi:hypothetical protein
MSEEEEYLGQQRGISSCGVPARNRRNVAIVRCSRASLRNVVQSLKRFLNAISQFTFCLLLLLFIWLRQSKKKKKPILYLTYYLFSSLLFIYAVDIFSCCAFERCRALIISSKSPNQPMREFL